MILQNSKLVDDLTFIANGDIHLVERAIVECADENNQAKLEDVVRHIVTVANISASTSQPLSSAL